MAVNGNVEELYGSAEKQIIRMVEILNNDKRSNKKWCEDVLSSVNVVKNILALFKDMLIQSRNQATVGTSVSRESYATITNPRKENSTRNVVLVRPKNPEHFKDSEQTFQAIRTLTNAKLHVGVKNVKKVKNKSVVLELRNNNECVDFVNSFEQDNSFTAIIPKKYNPRIIIHGIDLHFPEEALLAAISEQNPHIKQCLMDTANKMELRFMKASRDGRTKYAVLEVTPTIYQAVMNEAKLYIGYTRCTVRDHLHVIRCFNCLGFGHTSANCNSRKRCSYCAEEHDSTACPRNKMECANCQQFNAKMANRKNFKINDVRHPATSNECPAYIHIVQLIKSKINYG